MVSKPIISYRGFRYAMPAQAILYANAAPSVWPGFPRKYADARINGCPVTVVALQAAAAGM